MGGGGRRAISYAKEPLWNNLRLHPLPHSRFKKGGRYDAAVSFSIPIKLSLYIYTMYGYVADSTGPTACTNYCQ